MEEKEYSISQVSKMFSIPITTLRYYDEQGLLPGIKRTASGYRIFTESDLETLKLVQCFKMAGMSLKDIRQYFVWAREGDSSLEERYHLILARKDNIQKQIELLQEQMKVVEKKAAWYEEQIAEYQKKS